MEALHEQIFQKLQDNYQEFKALCERIFQKLQDNYQEFKILLKSNPVFLKKQKENDHFEYYVYLKHLEHWSQNYLEPFDFSEDILNNCLKEWRNISQKENISGHLDNIWNGIQPTLVDAIIQNVLAPYEFKVVEASNNK